MDVLVNFSDLVDKDRKDLSSWKAACSALNNMMRIYPECFSTLGDTFSPLRVHANVGSVEGVDQHSLEAFICKFLLALDNEVRIEKVDFSGEERFVKAGQQAAYCADIYGGVRHAQLSENPEISKLRHYVIDMKDYFDKGERRMLYQGIKIPVYSFSHLSVKGMSEELAIEFLAGGDRFSRFDISLSLDAHKRLSGDILDRVEDLVRKELQPELEKGTITADFLEHEVSVWIRNNDVYKDHLGQVFDQYSGKKKVNSERRSPKEVYREMTSQKVESKDKGMKI